MVVVLNQRRHLIFEGSFIEKARVFVVICLVMLHVQTLGKYNIMISKDYLLEA